MEPKWEIEKKEFLGRLGCSESDFMTRLSLPKIEKVERVVPLKHIEYITSLTPLSAELLIYLLRRVKTLSGELPFKDATFELSVLTPEHLEIGQRFVYRENYQQLLEGFSDLFRGFMMPSGFTQLGAYFICGKDYDGVNSSAFYIPPIVESHGKGRAFVIMDGIHRNYMVRQLRGSIAAIIVSDIALPFPCASHPWSGLSVINIKDKPVNIGERYFALREELFRDLKYLGIDG